MIEKTVLDYLKARNLTGIGNNVYAEVPVTPPERYIVIEKTASGLNDRIRSAMIAVQSYSRTSLFDAASISDAVIEAMDVMAENTNIYSCKLNSDYNYTNPQTKEYRYQAVFNIYY